MGDFLRGILIGMVFGVPAGTVGALTVQRTYRYGRRAGLLTGLGSSVADCFYAGVGIFGFTLISDFLLQYQTLINAIGVCLILIIGVSLLLKKTEIDIEQKTEALFVSQFLSSFIVGITNPASILTFFFAFSYFGILGKASLTQGILLVAGVFLGTYAWWGALTAITLMIQKKTAHFRLCYMNRVFGTILCLFGISVFIRFVL